MERSELNEIYGEGNVWTTAELREEFEVHSFLAPFAVVTRTVDNKKGSVQFIHSPRFYFDFRED